MTELRMVLQSYLKKSGGYVWSEKIEGGKWN